MMDMTETKTGLALIPFHGAAIEAVRDEAGKPWVVLKRLCQNLGIDDEAQRQKLTSLPWAGTLIIKVPSRGGEQATFCIDLPTLPLWLATIHPNKVREDAREVLVPYQRECSQVLHDHFFGARLTREEVALIVRDEVALLMRDFGRELMREEALALVREEVSAQLAALYQPLQQQVTDLAAQVAELKSRPALINLVVQGGAMVMQAPAPRKVRQPTAVREAVAWLKHKLAAGPVPATEMESGAAAEGITSATLRRARKKVGVVAEKKGGVGAGEGYWQWRLPGEASN